MKYFIAVLFALMVFAPGVTFATEEVAVEVTSVTEETTEASDTEEAEAEDEVIEEDEYEGIDVDEVTEAPSKFRMFFRGIGEQVRIATSFSAVKKAELRIKYAEERQAIAERILEESDDAEALERAQKVLDKSDAFVARVNKNIEKIVERAGNKQERFVENVSKFEQRRINKLSDLEEKILNRVQYPEKVEALIERLRLEREEGEQRNARLVNAIANEDVPERVRERLEENLQRMEEHQNAVREYQTEKRELLKAAKEGDEDAKDAIRELNESRKVEIQEKREAFKVRVDELKEAASEGDAAAKQKLQRVKQQTEKREAVRDAQEKKVEAHREAVQAGEAKPIRPALKTRVEKRQEVRQNHRDAAQADVQ